MLINLYFNYLLNKTKIWKLFFFLPVRGQRTRTNNNTKFNKKFFFFFLKNKFLKKKLPNQYFLTEFINLFFKIFFFNDWFLNKEKKLNFFKKNKFKVITRIKAEGSNHLLFLGLENGFSRMLV